MSNLNKSKIRVALGMSGGVDSSVAAFLLREQGFEVIGFMMKLWSDQTGSCARENVCCDAQGLIDARKVADILGIPFYVVDAREVFKEEVVDCFIDEYKSLRTPNPCIKCNEKIKFGWMVDYAKKMGCDYLATGHYARIVDDSGNSKIETRKSKLHLMRGLDAKKDQSYFLYRVDKDELAHVLFPVGELTKDEVREIAKRNKLPVYEKKESQEICFIADNYRDFLKRYLSDSLFEPGRIVDKKGFTVGEHNGLVNYTIGQRKGIEQFGDGKNEKRPLYVVGFNIPKNELIVGTEDELMSESALLDDLHWLADFEEIKKDENLKVKIRYRAEAIGCTIEKKGENIEVNFFEPQRAVTPGQSAVFYIDDRVVGGGVIQLKV